MVSWLTITRLAGITATAPVALGIAALLALDGQRRLALLWCLLFAAGLGIVVATKIAFIGWGVGYGWFDFTGASGHAMRATALAPVVLYLLLQKASRHVRIAGVLAGLAFGVLIGISRIAVRAHTLSEVVAGWMLGAMVSFAFIYMARSLRKPVFTPARIAVATVALLALALFARPVPTQHWLTKASLFLAGHDKPYMRAGGHAARVRAIDDRDL